MTTVKAAFRPDVITVKLKELVSSREISSRERKHFKYQQIATSIEAVGVVEPLVVFPATKGFRVLDGHKRLDILRSKNVDVVDCLIGTADDTYTYNRRVNYLSTVGEHQMILRALRHNSEATIAKALNVSVATIRKKRVLLDGICPEAVEVLKDKPVSRKAFRALRRMKPIRQIAAARLMVTSNVYTEQFAWALLAGTSDELLVDPQRSAKSKSLSAEHKTRLIAETNSLFEKIKSVETSYGQDALVLNVCCRYIEKLLNNKVVADYLGNRHGDTLRELSDIIVSFREETVSILPT
jgi:hypothetical protein